MKPATRHLVSQSPYPLHSLGHPVNPITSSSPSSYGPYQQICHANNSVFSSIDDHKVLTTHRKFAGFNRSCLASYRPSLFVSFFLRPHLSRPETYILESKLWCSGYQFRIPGLKFASPTCTRSIGSVTFEGLGRTAMVRVRDG